MHYLLRKKTKLSLMQLTLFWGSVFAPIHFSGKTPTHFSSVGAIPETRKQLKLSQNNGNMMPRNIRTLSWSLSKWNKKQKMKAWSFRKKKEEKKKLFGNWCIQQKIYWTGESCALWKEKLFAESYQDTDIWEAGLWKCVMRLSVQCSQHFTGWIEQA